MCPAPSQNTGYVVPALRTDSPEENAGRIAGVGLREERRKVGAVVGEALVVAYEAAASYRGVRHVEQFLGQAGLVAVIRVIGAVAGGRRMAVHNLVIGWQGVRVGGVVAEVVVGDRNGSVVRHVH